MLGGVRVSVGFSVRMVMRMVVPVAMVVGVPVVVTVLIGMAMRVTVLIGMAMRVRVLLIAMTMCVAVIMIGPKCRVDTVVAVFIKPVCGLHNVLADENG